MIMPVRPVQPLKASHPISCMPSGITMLSSVVQSSKAQLPIFVTPSGTVTFVSVPVYFTSTPFSI